MPYDPETALAPVALVVINPVVIMAAPGRPERSFADFLTTLRGGAPLNYSHSGVGGGGHMAMEVLKHRLGVTNLEHVPFRGAAPSLTALASGQVPFAIESITSAAGAIAGGLARPLAVTTARRWVSLPDVPTVQESGIPDFDYSSWTAFAVPVGTPAHAVARLNAATNAALEKPAIRARLIEIGADPVGGPPERLTAHLMAERARWREAVRIAGITAE